MRRHLGVFSWFHFCHHHQQAAAAMEIRPEWKSAKNGNHENMAFPHPDFSLWSSSHFGNTVESTAIQDITLYWYGCSNNLYMMHKSNVMVYTNDKLFNLLHSLSGLSPAQALSNYFLKLFMPQTHNFLPHWKDPQVFTPLKRPTVVWHTHKRPIVCLHGWKFWKWIFFQIFVTFFSTSNDV